MTNTLSNDQGFANHVAEQIHQEQLRRVELFNGRAACHTQFLPFGF
jgi:hypothetical protein